MELRLIHPAIFLMPPIAIRGCNKDGTVPLNTPSIVALRAESTPERSSLNYRQGRGFRHRCACCVLQSDGQPNSTSQRCRCEAGP